VRSARAGRRKSARAGEGAVAPFGEEAFEEFEEVGGAGVAAQEEGEEWGAGKLTGCDVGDGAPQVGKDETEGGGEALH
jgi:hypothetical protein